MTEETKAKLFAIVFVILLAMAVLWFCYKVLKKGASMIMSKTRKQDVSSYKGMQERFLSCFNQVLSDEEIAHKKGAMLGDEALPLGNYIWTKDATYIEYYVSWLPHYRGDSHGKIYKDGTREHLPTLPQIGEVTQREMDLREELKGKGFWV